MKFNPQNYIKEIFYLLGDNTKGLPIITFLFLVATILEIFSIGIIYPYINIILDYNDFTNKYSQYVDFSSVSKEQVIIVISAVLLISFLAKTILSIYVKKKIFTYSHKVSSDLRIKLLNSFQSFSYLRYLNKNSAEYIHSINNLSHEFQSNIKSILFILSEVVIVIAIAILLGLNNLTMLLVSFFIFSLFGLSFDLLFGKKLTKYGKEDNYHSSGLIKTILESVNGFKIIKIYNLKNFFLKKLIFHQTNFVKVRINLEIIKIVPKYIVELIIITIVILSSLYFLVMLNVETTDYLSILGLFAFASIRLIPSLNIIISQFANLRKTRHATSLLYKDTILENENKNEIIVKKNNKENISEFNNLRIENVSFKYNQNENYIIKNLNFNINKGDKIGIHGDSGAGKSTLIDIILGLLSPSNGQLYINDMNLNSVKKQWQSMISFTPQDIYLIDDTLVRNIALGLKDDEIDFNKIEKSIEKAKLNELVEQRENNSKMHIGEKGLKISGGQKQRIALARLFYFDSEVVILDEATSALDNETEDLLMNDIYELLNDKTLIIISHKKKNLIKCNRIIKIEKNNIIEEKNNDN